MFLKKVSYKSQNLALTLDLKKKFNRILLWQSFHFFFFVEDSSTCACLSYRGPLLVSSDRLPEPASKGHPSWETMINVDKYLEGLHCRQCTTGALVFNSSVLLLRRGTPPQAMYTRYPCLQLQHAAISERDSAAGNVHQVPMSSTPVFCYCGEGLHCR